MSPALDENNNRGSSEQYIEHPFDPGLVISSAYVDAFVFASKALHT